jgi:hypothetical protein
MKPAPECKFSEKTLPSVPRKRPCILQVRASANHSFLPCTGRQHK